MITQDEDFDKMIEAIKADKDGNYLIKISRDIVFNPGQSIKNRMRGLNILMDSAVSKRMKLEIGIKRMEAYHATLCDLAIREHKKNKILVFTEKWAGKEVCEEMAVEMRSIEKPNHCYQFNGSTLIEMDCNMCRSRKCEQGDKDYVPASFNELLQEVFPVQDLGGIDSEQESEVDNGENRE